jgi:hypothetical protein
VNLTNHHTTTNDDILYCADLPSEQLHTLLQRYGMQLVWVDKTSRIPGSYWGDTEAGLIENRLYVRADTPVHSALHEACHYICMDHHRRQQLDTDAGGGYDEENGVCYLQVLLSEQLAGMGKQRMFADMDRWGYSFRLGSSQAWFEHDAEDARQWLVDAGLINNHCVPTWKLRQ